ncbi:MAG TPA: four helix bundle protein [Acidobacteriaceae bacterium]|nr:four helix bundle protein [Acidobacteriaceae bacterium]
MAKCFRELVAWQRAMELTSLLYTLTRKFPREEIYGLSSQLRRAGVSIASDIAEGSGRGTRADYRSFLRIARGSTLEIQTQLIIARDLGFGDESQVVEAEKLAEQTQQNGLGYNGQAVTLQQPAGRFTRFFRGDSLRRLGRREFLRCGRGRGFRE